MKLILFDIDKTLTGGSNKSHEQSFSYAFKEVFGVDATIDIIDHPGMTDKQIIVEVLKKKGIEEKAIRDKMSELTEAMIYFFDKNFTGAGLLLLDGVKELLEDLAGKGFLMGLATGNLEPIARGKMVEFNLNQYFPIGGFGSDDEKRFNFIKMAIKKAEEKLDFKYNDNVFLVGDTPRDIVAGKEAGVKTIGVATGKYSKKDLEKSGADVVISNLKEKEAILNKIDITL